MSDDYLTKLFINEAKPALNRHSGGSGGGSGGVGSDTEIKPLTVTENGVYDVYKSDISFGETVTLKDKIDIVTLIEAVGRRDKIIDEGEVYLVYDQNSDIRLMYESDMNAILLFVYTDDAPYFRIDDTVRALAPAFGITIPDDVEGWVNFNTFEIVSGLTVTLPSEDVYNGAIERQWALTSKQNAEMLFVESVLKHTLSNPVTVNVPIPEGELSIKNNGTFDVTKYASANVNVPAPEGDIDITENGTYDVAKYASANVNVPSDIAELVSLKGGNADYLFQKATNATDEQIASILEHLDFASVTSMYHMFDGCKSLTTVPELDTSNVTRMSCMFSMCSSLTTVPKFDTSNVTDMNGMFNACGWLTTVQGLDMRSVRAASDMFTSCMWLTDVRIRNIKTSLVVGIGSNYGYRLTVDSLVHLIYELRDTGAVLNFTVGSANLEKLANVYVKTVDITDEMRAEDDLVDEKLPFVVCESTDEGAMPILDYVALKNWQVL